MWGHIIPLNPTSNGIFASPCPKALCEPRRLNEGDRARPRECEPSTLRLTDRCIPFRNGGAQRKRTRARPERDAEGQGLSRDKLQAMNPERPAHQLTSDLDPWEIRLVSGHVLHVNAHAYSEKSRDYVFVALM